MRPSAVAIVAGLILTGVTVWITREAKALENDLEVGGRRIALLDKPAPDFHLTTADGRSVSLADYHGKKKLLVIFWASWNNGSHPEMFWLNLLYRRSHTPESAFDIVGIAVDDDLAAVKQFAAESKTEFPLALDHNRALTDAYQVRSLPTAFIIDQDGKITYGSVGYEQRSQVEFARRLDLPQMQMMGVRGARGN
jgi:peroxiredoxin